jgi:hypothetical protein
MDARLMEIPKAFGVELDVSKIVSENMGFEEAKEIIINYCAPLSKPGIIEETYADMMDLIDCALDSVKLHSIVISSPPGLGKSYQAVKAMDKRGLSQYKDYIVISGYITPLEFYKKIYDYATKIIIVDDTDSVLASEEIRSMLLAMLWNPMGARKVTYASSTSKMDDRNNEFEFTGKLILLTNKVPKHLKAYLSRSFYYKFDIQRDRRLAMMYDMAKRQGIAIEIVDFIRDNTTKDTPNCDFRLMWKVSEIYATKHPKWKVLTLALLNGEDEILKTIIELAAGNLSVKEQEKQFLEMKIGSRATFYRRRKDVGLKEEKK